MAGRPRSIDNSKVFDVAKPGNAKPMGTSRPVIVSHLAPIKDSTVITVSGSDDMDTKLAPPSTARKVISPMLEQAPAQSTEKSKVTIINEPEAALDTAPIVTSKRELKLQPITQSAEELPVETQQRSGTTDPAEELAPDAETTEANQTVVDGAPEVTTELSDAAVATPEESAVLEVQQPKVVDEKEATVGTQQPDAPTQETLGSETASVDALAEASTKPKEEAKKAEDEAKKAADLQGLIDSKKYFVPLAHDSNQKKGSSNTFMIFLLIILLAAAYYVAVDAKIIDTGIPMPYHLFKQ